MSKDKLFVDVKSLSEELGITSVPDSNTEEYIPPAPMIVESTPLVISDKEVNEVYSEDSKTSRALTLEAIDDARYFTSMGYAMFEVTRDAEALGAIIKLIAMKGTLAKQLQDIHEKDKKIKGINNTKGGTNIQINMNEKEVGYNVQDIVDQKDATEQQKGKDDDTPN